MPQDGLSFFDERRAVVKANTDWGSWWQTVQEVHIQVKLEPGVRSKEVRVNVEPRHIECVVRGKKIFEGDLPRPVYRDGTIWTLENDGLCIVLSKADHTVTDEMWESLLSDGGFQPDRWTLHEMRKNLDLERFQMENPGMDFSSAILSKNYDRLPGWSNDKLAEMKRKSEGGEAKESN